MQFGRLVSQEDDSQVLEEAQSISSHFLRDCATLPRGIARPLQNRPGPTHLRKAHQIFAGEPGNQAKAEGTDRALVGRLLSEDLRPKPEFEVPILKALLAPAWP